MYEEAFQQQLVVSSKCYLNNNGFYRIQRLILCRKHAVWKTQVENQGVLHEQQMQFHSIYHHLHRLQALLGIVSLFSTRAYHLMSAPCIFKYLQTRVVG